MAYVSDKLLLSNSGFCMVYVSDKVLLGHAVCSIEQDVSHVLVTDVHGNTYKVCLLCWSCLPSPISQVLSYQPCQTGLVLSALSWSCLTNPAR